MKFLCGNCKAKYQIADEKVSGRTLRMKCRRCDHDILIDGHSMPATSNPPPTVISSPQPPRRGGVSVIPGPGRSGSGAHHQPKPPRAPGIPAPPGRALGRSQPPSSLSADFRRHVAAPPEVPQRTAPYDLWHVAIQDVPVGPMTRDELGRKIDAGAVTADSLCWREGMDDWRPLGELPELAALMRRPRDGRSLLPARSRAPAFGGPQGARGSAMPLEGEEFDDDGGEPTRIADMSGPNNPLTAGLAAAALRGTSGSASSPRIPVAAPALPQPVATPAPAPSAPIVSSARSGKGTSGLTTGIAVGLLAGILLVGGPMLYRNTWGSPAPTAPVEAPAPEVAKPAVITPEMVADVPEPEPEPEEAKPETKTAGATTTTPAPARKADPKAPAAPKDNLTEEQRRLLERMGGAGSSGVPDLKKPKSEATSSGPSLTAAQLSGVVQNNKSALQRCYETALRAAGGQQQDTIKVTVTVKVGESGSVKSVTTAGNGLGNMNDCLKTSVKRWRFPASGGESEFAFPLVFQPGA